MTVILQKHAPVLEGHLCLPAAPFIHSVSQSFDEYLLSAYSVPGTVPGARGVAKSNRPPSQGPSPPLPSQGNLGPCPRTLSLLSPRTQNHRQTGLEPNSTRPQLWMTLASSSPLCLSPFKKGSEARICFLSSCQPCFSLVSVTQSPRPIHSSESRGAAPASPQVDLMPAFPHLAPAF